MNDLIDAGLIEALELAQRGDTGAIQKVHAMLADAIRRDRLTPLMRDVLADMHEAIVAGDDVACAMLMQKRTGAPPQSMRDGEIFGEVEARLGLARLYERHRDTLASKGVSYSTPPLEGANGLFAEVARLYDIPSWCTVKNIYYRERAKHRGRTTE